MDCFRFGKVARGDGVVHGDVGFGEAACSQHTWLVSITEKPEVVGVGDSLVENPGLDGDCNEPGLTD